MKRTLLSCVVALASALALVACGSEPIEESTDAPISLTIDAPKVTLLSVGSGDKQLIEFADSGAQQDVQIEFSDGFGQGTGTATDIDAAPPLDPTTDTLTSQVSTKVAQDAPRDVTVQLNDPHHSNKEYAEDVSSVSGFELGWIAQPSGRADSVRLSAPTQATDQGRAIAELYLMKLLAQPVIFPTEEIGPGAQWTVDNRVTGDSTMLRLTTYTLESFQDGVAELELTMTERPAVAALSLADQGLDSELKVLSSTSNGSGTLTIDTRKPLPTDGELNLNTRVVYGEEDKPTRVFQDFNSGLRFS